MIGWYLVLALTIAIFFGTLTRPRRVPWWRNPNRPPLKGTDSGKTPFPHCLGIRSPKRLKE
jgi:hypothetical protein